MQTTIRYCKKRAIRLIRRFHLLFPLVQILLLLTFACVGVAFCSDVFFTALVRMSDGSPALALFWSYAVTLTFFTLFVAPIGHGVKVSVFRCLSSGRLDLAPVFCCFVDRHRYLRVLWHTVKRLFCFHIVFAFILFLSALSFSVGEYLLLVEREASAVLVFAVTLFVIFCVCLAYLLMHTDAFLWEIVTASAHRLSYREAGRLARSRMHSGYGAFFSLSLSFLPLWGLSVLLFGIPLIWVVPYYVVARVCLAAQLLKS